MTVIIAWIGENADHTKDDPIVYGPFPSGKAATHWAHHHLTVSDMWYWMPITIPAYA